MNSNYEYPKPSFWRGIIITRLRIGPPTRPPKIPIAIAVVIIFFLSKIRCHYFLKTLV